MASSSVPICHACNKPVLDGEQRWAGKEPEQHWHYVCAEAAGLAHVKNVFIRADLADHTRPAGAGPRAVPSD